MEERQYLIRVLLVEDIDFIRNSLRLSVPWLDLGCIVVGDARDGEEALNLFERIQPDIVITDIRMPRMNGLELIAQIYETYHYPCQFIILSAYGEFSYAQQAIRYGCQSYLLKPVDPEELEREVCKAVRKVQESQRFELLRDYIDGDKSARLLDLMLSVNKAGRTDHVLSEAIRIVYQRYAEPLTAQMVADSLFISKSSLTKLFKAKTNYTFLEFLTGVRIQMALDLLQNSDLKVYEIAEQVGYQNTRYFSDLFEKYMGVKPSGSARGGTPPEKKPQ